MMSVIVFVSDECTDSQLVRSIFLKLSIPFEEINIDVYPRTLIFVIIMYDLYGIMENYKFHLLIFFHPFVFLWIKCEGQL